MATRAVLNSTPLHLRRRRPSWWDASPRKAEPKYGRPQMILWSHVPPAGHACRSHPQFVSAGRPGFEPQFYPIEGMTSPAMEGNRAYLEGIYATLNPATDMLDLTAEQLDNKCRVHGQWMARYTANNLFLDNLFRGRGSHNDGQYGGAFFFGHLMLTSFRGVNAKYCFAPLMQHPLDAAPRTSTLKYSAGASRSITLPKRTDSQASVPILGTSQAVVDQIEALVDADAGVRHVGYYTMRTLNARATIRKIVRYFAIELKAQCDAYVIPAGFSGAGTTVELTYPKFVPHTVEQFGYVGTFPVARLVGDTPNRYYELAGSFHHERGDPDNLRPQFIGETIFQRRSDGKPMSLRDAMLDDPVLRNSPWLTEYAPQLTVQPRNVTQNENYGFRRLEFQAADWAIEDAVMSVLRESFPEIESVNFDFVEVKDPLVPYVRVGGGAASAQRQTWMTYQGPTLYGRNGGATVQAIKDRVAGSVEAWDWNNGAEMMAIMDFINPDKASLAFTHGVYTQDMLAAGTWAGKSVTEWGGTPELFKQVHLDTHERRGVNHFAIYQGDLDFTYRTAAELLADLEGV